MKRYRAQKHFSWGSITLEPLQYLAVEEGDFENSLSVIKEHTQEKIVVSKQAFQNHLQLGLIAES